MITINTLEQLRKTAMNYQAQYLDCALKSTSMEFKKSCQRRSYILTGKIAAYNEMIERCKNDKTD